MTSNSLTHQECSLQIYAEDNVKIFLADLQNIAGAKNARIIHANINSPVLGDYLLDCFVYFLLTGNIDVEESRARYAIGRSSTNLFINVEHHDPGTFRREPFGNSQSNALSGSCNHGNLIF